MSRCKTLKTMAKSVRPTSSEIDLDKKAREIAKSALLAAFHDVSEEGSAVAESPINRLHVSRDFDFGAALSQPYLCEPGFPYHGANGSSKTMGCPCCGSEDIDLLGVEEVRPYEEERNPLHLLFGYTFFGFYHGGFAASFICEKGHQSVLVVSRDFEAGLHAGWFFADPDYELARSKARKAKEVHVSRPTQKQIDYLRDLAKRLDCLEDIPADITKTQAGFLINWFRCGIVPPLDRLEEDWSAEFDRIQGPPIPDWRVMEIVKKAEARDQNEPRIEQLRELGAATQADTGIFVKSMLPDEVKDDFQSISVWKSKKRVPKEGELPVIMHPCMSQRFTIKEYYHKGDVRKMTPEEAALLKEGAKKKRKPKRGVS
mgnify:CR=1 FL=1